MAGNKNTESVKGKAHGHLGSNPSSRAYKVQCKLGDMTSFLLDQLPQSAHEAHSASPIWVLCRQKEIICVEPLAQAQQVLSPLIHVK